MIQSILSAFKGFDLTGFNINELIVKPNAEGIIEHNNQWYLYAVDDRCEVLYSGPFSTKSVIYAIAVRLHVGSQFKEHKFSEQDRYNYLHPKPYLGSNYAVTYHSYKNSQQKPQALSSVRRKHEQR